MSLNIYALGNRICIARKKAGLSQDDLAERVLRSSTFISYIENGSKGMSLETFVNVSNALQMTADELLLDSLDNSKLIISAEFENILKDCNSYERRVLLDILVSVKDILRTNRGTIFLDSFK